MKREPCKNRNHNDQRLRGGKHYECRTCLEVFPCRGSCPHLDCIVATGRELPDNVGPGAREAIAAELALLYPDHSFSCSAPVYVVDSLAQPIATAEGHHDEETH